MIHLLSIQLVAERGGSDQALVRMIQSLPRDRFRCHVALPRPSPLEPEFYEAGATLHVVPMERISTTHRMRNWAAYATGWPLAVARLVKLIRELDVDVVHSNSLHSWYGWAAASLTRRPHVWHAREIVVQSRAALGLERFLARAFAARVICMSGAVAAQLHSANTVVIHETPDPSLYNPGRAGRFRTVLDIPDQVPLVGAAGRIDTWKGFDVLLDAFGQARRRRPELQLAVAGGHVSGKEGYARGLEARAAALGGVHWLGPRTDMPEVLADLDLFVLPSTEPEPYGLVLVEALASGVPVVATDAGGPREILAAAIPGSGRLVPPRDAATLADALVELLPSEGETSSATRKARSVLRRPEPQDRFAHVFEEVARQRPGRGPRGLGCSSHVGLLPGDGR
ncbi:MAG: glycosyltransferase [Actinomycetota bacterium]|nr:glycosyltransferase [Actinomycetota bacterium]